MKKLKLTLALVFLFLVTLLPRTYSSSLLENTNNGIVTDFDETEIYDAFNDVDALVKHIESNNVSYSELEASDNMLIANVSSEAAIINSYKNDEPPVIGAFLWGCLFGPVGIVVVAVTTDSDKEMIKKAAWGCAIPAGCTAVSYIVYYVVYIAAATTYY